MSWKRNSRVVLLVLLMALGFALPVRAGAEVGPPQAPAGVSTDWWTQAQAQIRQTEYHPSPATADTSDRSAIVQAPNRAHNFRSTFTSDGLRVKPRTATGADWTWGLSLVAIGAPGDLRRLETAHVRLNGQRVELVRGTLTEWYINDQRGLEQGFTLHTPPPGSAGAAELVLRLAVHGTLVGSLDHDGATLAFTARNGKPMLHFGHLLAVDATGRKLPARFRLGAGNLDITVATTAAQYPLLIDPLATSPNWTAESDQAGAYFGTSVSTAGDVNNDGFADVIVGAPSYSSGETHEGAIAVYFGSSTGLNLIAVQTRQSNQASANFGISVGTAGDVNNDGYADVIVGADYYDNGQTDEGRAYVFHGSATGLGLTPWTAESNQIGAHFGQSVGTAGDVNNDGFADVIVGAPSYDSSHIDGGAAAVYLGSAFGLSSGSALPNWMAESDQESAYFGEDVSTAGDVNRDGYDDVIIGAPGYDNGESSEGRAYVFHGTSTGLSATPNWTAESNKGSAFFGTSVSTAGDVNGDGYADVLVGASRYSNDQPQEGRAFVFHGSASGLNPTPNWTAESDQYLSYFGGDVCTAGDVNGDGFDDVIVGASRYSNGQIEEGRAFVYYGSAAGAFYVIPTPSGPATIIYLD